MHYGEGPGVAGLELSSAAAPMLEEGRGSVCPGFCDSDLRDQLAVAPICVPSAPGRQRLLATARCTARRGNEASVNGLRQPDRRLQRAPPLVCCRRTSPPTPPLAALRFRSS